MRPYLTRTLNLTALAALAFIPGLLLADNDEPMLEIDPTRQLVIELDIVEDPPGTSIRFRQVTLNDIDAHVHAESVITKLLKEKRDYPGEIKIVRFPAKADPEDEQVLRLRVFEWRNIAGFNEINARVNAQIINYAGVEKLGNFSGRESLPLTSISSRATRSFNEALEESLDKVYKELEKRFPNADDS